MRPERRKDVATGFLDAFKLPFDFVETIVRDLGFRRPIGQFAFKLLDELVILGRKRFDARARSEEHTSELQSLMRISYAVFCLKKTTTTKHTSQHATELF